MREDIIFETVDEALTKRRVCIEVLDVQFAGTPPRISRMLSAILRSEAR
jgi:hypothetical protein